MQLTLPCRFQYSRAVREAVVTVMWDLHGSFKNYLFVGSVPHDNLNNSSEKLCFADDDGGRKGDNNGVREV